MQKAILCCFYGFLSLIQSYSFGQEYRQNILNVSSRGGLSQNTTTAIVQDSQGFLWVGTQDGLNRYDGYEFKVFRSKEDDTTQLTNNYIRTIAIDANEDLWLGTQIGLNKYDNKKGIFRHYLTGDHSIMEDSRWVITDIMLQGDELWVGTEKGLLHASSLTNPDFKVYNQIPDDSEIIDMVMDKSGYLWIATGSGDIYAISDTSAYRLKIEQWNRNLTIGCINVFDNQIWIGASNGLWSIPRNEIFLKEEKIVVIPQSKVKGYVPPVGVFDVQSVFQDSYGKVWIGTHLEGVWLLDPKRESITPVKDDQNSLGLLKGISVNEIFEDAYRNIWVGTVETGLFKIQQVSKRFGLLRSKSDQESGLTSNRIRGLMEKDDALWVGSSKGITIFNRDLENLKTLFSDPNNPNTLSSDDIKAIENDRFGNVWAGTNNGLNRISMPNYQIQRFYASDEQLNQLIFENRVRCISSLSDGNIWVGTYGGGISVIDPANSQLLSRYYHDSEDTTSISSNNIMNIYEDSRGTIWASTYGGGLNWLNDKGDEWYQIGNKKKTKFPQLLSSINEDKKGFLWIGTYGNGVIKLNIKDFTYSILSESNGLSNNVTYAAIPLKEHVWISTNFGINRYHQSTGTFTTYNVTDGLQGNEFNTNSYLLSDSGEIFFGGINGLTFFYPDSITESKSTPDIAFTDLLIFNMPVAPGEVIVKGEPPIKQLIRDSTDVVLSHYHNVFTIEFTALDFVNPEDIRYAHRLVGFEDNWIYTKTDQRSATYTNLKPGTYEFQLKASNNDGNWNHKPITLFIKINPSIWETYWFRFSLVAFLIGISVMIISNRINKVERRKTFLEEQIDKHTKEISEQNKQLKRSSDRLKNLNRKKDQMFYLLAHNVRAPLTTLKALFYHYTSNKNNGLNVLDDFLDGLNQNVSESIQLLDNTFYWSKLQFDDLYITNEKIVLTKLIDEALRNFDKQLVDKNISIVNTLDEIELRSDRKMLLVIINNLIKNAIKYSYPNSSINIKSEIGTVSIKLSIEDHGIGLTEEEVNNVFNEERNINRLGTTKEKGTGLGLLLSYKLAQRLGCNLSVQSGNTLTRFSLEIPK